MPLLALDTKKSMCQSSTGIFTQAKLDMASTIKVSPRSWHRSPTGAMSFSRPVVVSECTMQTWVIAGSASSISRMRSTCGMSL